MAKSDDWSISVRWVYRISMLYLLVPFCIFCIGFLKFYIGIPITILLIWVFKRFWDSQESQEKINASKRNWIFLAIIVFLWVFLSGIGGFSFQNTDFHIRNAIFHDLINYSWPVKYNSNPLDPSATYFLTYYIGFWLPAALVGKIVGWQIANIVLFLWTIIGICLILLLLVSKTKLSPAKLALLLIFFSGMDGLGTFLKILALGTNNAVLPTLWPPIQHLEPWAPGFQYSSFTTQLFWVFNQAIPAWVCMALLITAKERSHILLTWSLCCFLAPLPAIGMFPFVLLKMPRQVFNPENIRDKIPDFSMSPIFTRAINDLRSLLTLENVLGGGIVLIITYLYFSANVQTSEQTMNQFSWLNWIFYPIFIILEGLFLWYLLKGYQKNNLNWYLAGILLLTIPLVKIGSSQDFCMRASIPMLFMLMVWSAEMLAGAKSQARTFLIILLCIGAITPMYEINRSIYRTARYYLNPPTQAEKLEGEKVYIYTPQETEYDHPYTLVADSFKSLANFDPEKITNFLAREDHTLFETYLEK